MSKEYDKIKRQPEAQNIRQYAINETKRMIDKYLLDHQKITEKYYITRDFIDFNNQFYIERLESPINYAKECLDIVYGSIVLCLEESYRAGKMMGGYVKGLSFGGNNFLEETYEKGLKYHQREFIETLEEYEKNRAYSDNQSKNSYAEWFSRIKKLISDDNIRKIEKYIEMLAPIKSKFLEDFNYCNQKLENFKSILPELRKDISSKISAIEKLVYSKAEYEKARMQSSKPIKEARDEFEKLSETIEEMVGTRGWGIQSKFWSIHNKIKSEYPNVPDFDSFNIYKIPKLKLIEQQDSVQESQSVTSQIDKLKSDFESYLELHSHDQDSYALVQMQGVINASHESLHNQEL